jgi:hypothetical protein
MDLLARIEALEKEVAQIRVDGCIPKLPDGQPDEEPGVFVGHNENHSINVKKDSGEIVLASNGECCNLRHGTKGTLRYRLESGQTQGKPFFYPSRLAKQAAS